MVESTDFQFSLEESAAAAHHILSKETANDLEYWKHIVNKYKKAKEHLINALDPETGRKVLPVQWEDKEKAPVRFRIAAHTIVNSEPLSTFCTMVSDEELYDGKVGNGTPLTRLCAHIRKGQKITRALAAYLKERGVDNNEASQLVGKISEKYQLQPKQGNLVLSANILDILLCSESCSYSSCHSLDGCHRAGPQQYLYDPHTLVAYYFEEYRALEKYRYKLPYKLFRQLVYVDTSNKSAAMMRIYGQELPDEVHQKLRRLTGQLLAKLNGDNAQEQKWYLSENTLGFSVDNGAELAYVDPASCFVQLNKGQDYRPRICLANSVPCPSCGDNLEKPDVLICKSCSEVTFCYRCECRIRPDDSVTDNSGNTFCTSCYSETYTECDTCHQEVDIEDINEVDDYGNYCNHCLNIRFITCCECNEYIPREDTFTIDDYSDEYCESCYAYLTSTCAKCSKTFHNDDLTEHGPDAELFCTSCLEEIEKEEDEDDPVPSTETEPVVPNVA